MTQAKNPIHRTFVKVFKTNGRRPMHYHKFNLHWWRKKETYLNWEDMAIINYQKEAFKKGLDEELDL